MITLEQARENIGSKVIYRAFRGGRPEEGIVTSVNDRYVFVRYTGDTTSKATNPHDLEFLGEHIEPVQAAGLPKGPAQGAAPVDGPAPCAD